MSDAAPSSSPNTSPGESQNHSRYEAVFFDFGGVITESPFEAFARYETEAGLPPDLIRTINATNPDDNAWARLERSEVDQAGFAQLFEAEAAALGHDVDGDHVVALLSGPIRPRMVEALGAIKAAGLPIACLTNNFRSHGDRPGLGPKGEVLGLFDVVIESSVVGVRKPEPEFYRIALEAMSVSADKVVFLDDLGVNLKPARAMGMTTIKVTDPDTALAELGQLIGVTL